MLALEARRMGYRVHTLSPGVDTPTGQVADLEVSAEYDDIDAIRAFARGVDVMTFEFENVSTKRRMRRRRSSGAGRAARRCTSPSSARGERRSSPIAAIPSRRSRRRSRSTSSPIGLGLIGLPAIVKTAAFGYDGKGQHRSIASKTASASGD
jgi:5-(carboxyamino)imidazole ribonucleotide synthase